MDKSMLALHALRSAWRSPMQLVLAFLGIALGVAVVTGIDLSNSAAEASFARSSEQVAGRATHSLVGAEQGIDESVYTALRMRREVPMAPVVDGWVTSASLPGRPLRLLGIDPVAEYDVRAWEAPAGEDGKAAFPLAPFFLGSDVAVVATSFAVQESPDSTVWVSSGGKTFALKVERSLRQGDSAAEGSASDLSDVLVVDISTAQRILNRAGYLSRIDVIAEDTSVFSRWRATLPSDVRIERSEGRTAMVEDMTAAFSLNLSALSLLSLLVGMFLIFNAASFAVVRRRKEVGLLRALGATRRFVILWFLGEAALIGTAATAVGIVLGMGLAHLLIGFIAQTINDLYTVVAVTSIELTPTIALKVTALGIGSAIVAALLPAYEAASTSPGTAQRRSSAEDDAGRRSRRGAWIGAALASAGGLTLLIPSKSVLVGYLGLLPIVAGTSLMIPALARLAVYLLAPVGRVLFGIAGAMAVRGVVTSLSRTHVAMAALMTAVAATVGVGTMVGSFRATVDVWLHSLLVDDIFISAPTLQQRHSTASVYPEALQAIRSTEGVHSLSLLCNTRIYYRDMIIDAMATEPDAAVPCPYNLLEAEPRAWADLKDGKGIFVSEPLAWRTGLSVGDTAVVNTPAGERRYRVLAVHQDYGSDLGVMMMHRSLRIRDWGDSSVTGLGLTVAAGANIEQVLARLRAATAAIQYLEIRSQKSLLDTSLAIFDRTFAITSVLRLLTVIVAFIGVAGALSALQIERENEYSLLRALGFLPGQVRQAILTQTTVMGIVSGVAALPLGYALAAVLVYIVNRRSFGWTLSFNVTLEEPAIAIAVAVGASLAAAVIPALRIGTALSSRSLRDE